MISQAQSDTIRRILREEYETNPAARAAIDRELRALIHTAHPAVAASNTGRTGNRLHAGPGQTSDRGLAIAPASPTLNS